MAIRKIYTKTKCVMNNEEDKKSHTILKIA